MSAPRSIPVALTIAGSDSSAGAGVQADLKTFSALQVYGLTAITCVVAETPGRVRQIQAIDPAMVTEQIALLLDNFPVRAIKTGMLYSAEIASTVARTLRENAGKIPVVIDPIMVATSGDLLLQSDAIAIYETELFPLAALITPNLDEAATLFGGKISDLATMHTVGEQLHKRYGVPLLLKGGHLGGAHATDLLWTTGGIAEFSAPFTRGVHTHGTGCTYSAAITAGLASGMRMEEAVARGKRFVSAAIARHLSWKSEDGTEIHALDHAALQPNE